MNTTTRIEYFGRLQVHQPAKPAPARPDHTLVSDHAWYPASAVHRCTGCSWTVTTYRPLSDRSTAEALHEAFGKHIDAAQEPTA